MTEETFSWRDNIKFAGIICLIFFVGFVVAANIFDARGYNMGQKDALRGHQKYTMLIYQYNDTVNNGMGFNANNVFDTVVTDFIPKDTIFIKK
jgi:hypothetical protein